MSYQIKGNLCSLSLTIAILLLLEGTSVAQIDLFPRNVIVQNNFTATAGQNNINFFKHNQIVWVDDLKYTTLAGSLADTQCFGGSVNTTCQDEINSNHTETITSGITLGNNTNTAFQHVHGYPGAKITCNVTGGNPCFTLLSGSAISGEFSGSSSGGTAGPFQITYPSTANLSCLFCTNTSLVGGSSYIKLANLFSYGNASATVPIVADLVAVNNLPITENFYFANFPSIGLNVRSGSATSAVAGPFLFMNIWMDGFNNAGARPWVFTADATSHNSIGNINILGGVANHPGSSHAMMEFTGNSAGSATMRGINVIGTYFEDLAVSSSTTAIKFSDVHAAHVSGDGMTLTANGIGIDISQSAAGRTCGIVLTAVNETSPGNTATFINNHITTFTTTGPDLPFYLYGGDSSCSTVPFTVESLPAVFTAVGNAAIAVPVGEVTSKFSGATLHAYVAQDTEASGKTVGFGPGSTIVSRFSIVDTSDSNTELFDCGLSTTGGCSAKNGLTVGNPQPNTTQNAVSFAEVAAPTAVAAFDALYGDSTAHALKLSNNNGTFFNVTQTIASGTAAMPTSSVAAVSGTTITCVAAAGNPFTATGVATTDTITFSPNAAPSSPATGLIIQAWPTSGGVNFEYCNPTASALTPSAETLNWRVMR